MTWLDGACHCGALRFRVRVAGSEREALDCNCSMCRKKGFLHLIVERADFELTQGGDELSEYRFGTGVALHTFCRTCGIHPFYTPRSHPEGVDVNVRCLAPEVADTFTVVAFDGERWEDNVESIGGRLT